MLMRIKAMSKADVQNLTYSNVPICTPGTEGLANVTTKEIFSRTDISSQKREALAEYVYNGYIDLEVTWVPNYFIAGTKLSLLNNIFDEDYFNRVYNASEAFNDKLSVKSIMDGKFVYNTEEASIMSISEFKSVQRSATSCKVGGEVLRILIDNMVGSHEDEESNPGSCRALVEQEIMQHLAFEMTAVLRKAGSDAGISVKRSWFKMENIGITKQETDFHIIDDYYIMPMDGLEESLVYRNAKFVESFKNAIDNNFLSRIDLNRLSHLLSMRDSFSRKNFRNLVQDFVTVIPIAYRPSVNKRNHHFVIAYSNVIQALSAYKGAYASPSVNIDVKINAYKALNSSVQNIMTTPDAQFKTKLKDSYKPLAEMLKGPKGHIRGKMQSSTIDYAGRAVIICDQSMPIDTVGIPYKMLRECLDISFIDDLKDRTTKTGESISIRDKIDRLNRSFLSDGSLEKMNKNTGKMSDGVKKQIRELVRNGFVVVGRQPTLYRHGAQSFKIKPVDGASIVLPLLVTPPFNADFDGDQMWFTIAISDAAKSEVREKMFIINNIFYAKDGTCTIIPRHEIIYGLYVASSMKPTGSVVKTIPSITAGDLDDLKEMLFSGKYKLNDIVLIQGIKMSLGKAVVHACFTRSYFDVKIGDTDFTQRCTSQQDYDSESLCEDKWCQELLTHIYSRDLKSRDLFTKVCDNFTRVGISVAKQYPPDLSCLKVPDITHLKDEFYSEIRDIQNDYMFGFETEESYSDKYDKVYKKYSKLIEQFIYDPNNEDSIGPNNGFRLLAESRARGNKSTIMQMFGIKGKMQKNSMEVFNCVIFNNMVNGLTGLEHNMTAFGGRQGQIDKSVETSKPGYLSRRIGHAAANYIITSDDCRTSNGVLINYRILSMHLEREGSSQISVWSDTRDLFKEIIVGKSLVLPDGSSHRVTSRNADDFFEAYIASVDSDGNVEVYEEGIRMRSPITCDNPCCAVCYGIDPATGLLPVASKHKKIGLEAATTVGEPATQMTMKNFQKGGVAGDANLTSSFDLINTYLGLTDLDTSEKKTGVRVSDVLSPVEGPVVCQQTNTNVKQVYVMDPENPSRVLWPKKSDPITMYYGVKTKDYVKRGDNLQAELGNLDIDNVIDILGIDFALSYLLMKLYMIYRSEVKVKICHFETIIASMQIYVCKNTVSTDNYEYTPGNSYSDIELKQHGGYRHMDCFVKQIVGVDATATRNHNAFRGVMFEDQSRNVASHIVRSPYDYMEDVYTKMSFGFTRENGGSL